MVDDNVRRAFDRALGTLNRAVMADDEARIRIALANPVPAEVLRVPALLARLRRSRGNTFVRIGEYEAAEAEYSAGFPHAPYDVRGDFLLDWALASVSRLFLPGTQAEKRSACIRCIQVLEAADDQADFTSDAPYLIASTNAVRGFVNVYLGDNSAARKYLEAIRPPTLPPRAQDDPDLASFFTQLPKGIAAALDLRDGAVLRSVCRAALTGREDALVEVDSLSTGEQCAMVLTLRRDTPKFHETWWGMVRLASALEPKFSVLRQLAKRMQAGADPVRFATFVDSACT